MTRQIENAIYQAKWWKTFNWFTVSVTVYLIP